MRRQPSAGQTFAFSTSTSITITLLAAIGLLVGCTASSADVEPPADELYFPTGLAIGAGDTDLYVVNGNSDLRFDSGVLGVINIPRVLEVVEAWDGGEIAAGQECAPDLSFPLTLICTETNLLEPSRAVRIGNFATEVAVQTLTGGGARLFVAVRGDPSITYVDVPAAGAALTCSDSADFGECDEEHRLTSFRGDPDLAGLPDEPFGLHADSTGGFVIATHLSNGAITLVDAPPDGALPVLSDAIAGVFSPDQNTNSAGAVGVAGRRPGVPGSRIYVTSRTDSRIQTLLVSSILGAPKQLVSGGFFFLDKVLPSDDSRGIAFSGDGDRAFVVSRDPPSLQIVDTSMDITGVPVNETEGVVELCRQASNIEVTGQGVGERLYIACFLDGEVWVVDPASRTVESIISVGRGPQFLVASEPRGLLFVSNFRENTIAVIDIRPGSATQNRVVLRIGRPGETEGVE